MRNIYRIIDTKTGAIAGVFGTVAAAYARADKLNAIEADTPGPRQPPRFIVTQPSWGAATLAAGPL
jgi:hypothetical protein